MRKISPMHNQFIFKFVQANQAEEEAFFVPLLFLYTPIHAVVFIAPWGKICKNVRDAILCRCVFFNLKKVKNNLKEATYKKETFFATYS